MAMFNYKINYLEMLWAKWRSSKFEITWLKRENI
jgi:hypothetical protein